MQRGKEMGKGAEYGDGARQVGGGERVAERGTAGKEGEERGERLRQGR